MDNQTSHELEGTSGGNEDGEHDSSMTYAPLHMTRSGLPQKVWKKILRSIGIMVDFSSKDFNEILVETAESYDGVTGEIDLNLAGDRISENYDFWYVVKDDSADEFKWEAKFNDFNSGH